MPLIHIDILEGRSEQLKRQLITNVTNTVEETLSAPRESIRVIITEIPKSNWAVGGIPMSERQQGK